MKKILMLLAFAGVASVASAQQTVTVTEYEVIQVQDKHQVITNPFLEQLVLLCRRRRPGAIWKQRPYRQIQRPCCSDIERVSRQMGNTRIRAAYAIQRTAGQRIHHQRNCKLCSRWPERRRLLQTEMGLHESCMATC